MQDKFDNNVINMDINKFKGISAGAIIAIFIAVIILSKAIYVVNAGERAVIFNSFTGIEQRALSEGMHFLIPGIQNPVAYTVRTQTYTMASGDGNNARRSDDALECLTSDGQKIKVDMSVRYSLNPENIWKLHKTVGPEYEQKIIKPEVRSLIRNIIAEYPVIQLYSGEKRTEVQDKIQKQLSGTLSKYYINTHEALIRNVKFSEEFAKAIEEKQVELQRVERKRYEKQREELESERKIIQAKGDAEAIKIKGTALKQNPLIIQKEYVEKLAPGVKTIITDQNAIMNFPADLFKN